MGGDGNDLIFSSSANDLIFGKSGNDIIFGGKGSDTLRGGKGSDRIKGGDGSDLFVLASGDGTDRIKDFKYQFDRIGLSGGLGESDINLTIEGRNTVITAGNETLAILEGVNVSVDLVNFSII